MSRTSPTATSENAADSPAAGSSHAAGPPTFSRRTVVAGAGVAAVGAGLLVAGCSSSSGSAGSGGSGSGSSATGPLGPTTDVPVGSAKIYGDQGIVVTQATAGTFAGFSTTCPHQGCNVNEVQGASIVCPCHGSTFALDGSVERGPAQRGLTAESVKVEGGQIVRG